MKEIALKHPNAFDNAYNSSSGSSRNLEIFARRITKQEDRTLPRVFFLNINNSLQACIHSFTVHVYFRFCHKLFGKDVSCSKRKCWEFQVDYNMMSVCKK